MRGSIRIITGKIQGSVHVGHDVSILAIDEVHCAPELARVDAENYTPATLRVKENREDMQNC